MTWSVTTRLCFFESTALFLHINSVSACQTNFALPCPVFLVNERIPFLLEGGGPEFGVVHMVPFLMLHASARTSERHLSQKMNSYMNNYMNLNSSTWSTDYERKLTFNFSITRAVISTKLSHFDGFNMAADFVCSGSGGSPHMNLVKEAGTIAWRISRQKIQRNRTLSGLFVYKS